MKLTVFYDAQCPLCSAEINQLKQYDTEKQLVFEDIHAADFTQRFEYIDREKANAVLHGQLSNGEMIYGLDVTCMAWRTVGRHRWLIILRWPVIRWFADLAYRFFARYRNTISSLFIGRHRSADCESCRVTLDRDG